MAKKCFCSFCLFLEFDLFLPKPLRTNALILPNTTLFWSKEHNLLDQLIVQNINN